MLPHTPTTTTRFRNAARSAGAMTRGAPPARGAPRVSRGAAGGKVAGEHQERRHDLVGAPHRGIDDHVVAREIQDVHVVGLPVPAALTVFPRLDVARGRWDVGAVTRRDARRADPERRAQPDTKIAVDQPAAEA